MFKNPQQQSLLLGGVNMAGLLSLTAYTIRTLNETNASLLEMRQELEQIKGTFSENNKRSNVAFSRLNQRIEENVQIVNNQNHLLEGVKKHSTVKEEPPPVEEVSSEEEEEEEVEISVPKKRVEQVDEITSALNALMA